MRLHDTQNLTDGELYYTIHNGIRLTGMPAWGTAEEDDDSWKLVVFIRHLPKLTPAEEREMEALNPKGPGEKKEEQEEEQFLNEGQAIRRQNNQRITITEENYETHCRSLRFVIRTFRNVSCPWKREAPDGHGYQHFRQLHYGGNYIEEDGCGDVKHRDEVPKEWVTSCPERSKSRR